MHLASLSTPPPPTSTLSCSTTAAAADAAIPIAATTACVVPRRYPHAAPNTFVTATAKPRLPPPPPNHKRNTSLDHQYLGSPPSSCTSQDRCPGMGKSFSELLQVFTAYNGSGEVRRWDREINTERGIVGHLGAHASPVPYTHLTQL
ncbi:hypothetical protein E2C01_060270 [Portunus trituberculatus]|uniref:Uncharacterized protein n=1 Tax=Portunus trituberculatus TaxID=210409 RepID=A0A5B7H8U1_PORTR|nr:hypothetical protein [Portunus trituberculatus]